MKVAFATTDGQNVDEHFGRAGMFAIYDLDTTGYCFVELRRFGDGIDRAVAETKGMGRLHEDRVQDKTARLADCKIVYLTEIGGPSAARLIRLGMMTIRVKEVTAIGKSLESLLDTIRTSPPPWLRKAIANE